MVATLTTVLVLLPFQLLLDCDRIVEVVLVVDDCISATVGTDDSEPTPDRTEVNGTNTILGVLGSGGGGGCGGAVVDVDVPVDVNVDVNVDVVDVLVDVVAVPVLKGLPFNNFCECDNRLGCRCFFALDGDSSSRG